MLVKHHFGNFWLPAPPPPVDPLLPPPPFLPPQVPPAAGFQWPQWPAMPQWQNLPNIQLPTNFKLPDIQIPQNLHLPNFQLPKALPKAIEQPLYLYKKSMRDDPINYLGYVNEVAQAFGRLIGPANWFVGAFALMSSLNRSLEGYKRAEGRPEQIRKVEAYDYAVESIAYQAVTNIWGAPQLVGQIRQELPNAEWLKARVANEAKRKNIGITAGLLAIPLLVKPIDKLSFWLFDKGYVPAAKWVKQKCWPEHYDPKYVAAAVEQAEGTEASVQEVPEAAAQPQEAIKHETKLQEPKQPEPAQQPAPQLTPYPWRDAPPLRRGQPHFQVFMAQPIPPSIRASR